MFGQNPGSGKTRILPIVLVGFNRQIFFRYFKENLGARIFSF